MLLGMLLVLKVAAFLRECNQVGKDHSTIADMEERLNGAGLNVLGMVVVQPSLKCILQIVGGKHRLHMFRHLLHLQALDLAVEFPHRHLLHRNLMRERERERGSLSLLSEESSNNATPNNKKQIQTTEVRERL